MIYWQFSPTGRAAERSLSEQRIIIGSQPHCSRTGDWGSLDWAESVIFAFLAVNTVFTNLETI